MSSMFSRLNPTPAFPPYSGPYQVGSVDFEIAASELQSSSSPNETPLVPTVAFRCFYPCEPPSKPAQPVHWVQSPQRSTLSAYVRFGGVNPALSNILAYFPRLLYYITLPVHRDAQILSPPPGDDRWPVVVFSHGLGGSRNSYSHICGSLASHGLVVFATEHRDASCPVSYVRATDSSEAYFIDYHRYPHKPSQEVYDGRDQQLRIRLWEMNTIWQALLKIDAGTNIKNLNKSKSKSSDSAAMFHNMLDLHTPGGVTWAGHSFGATTVTQLTKSVFYARHGVKTSIYPNPPPQSLEAQITPKSPTMLLDLWALPLNSPATESLRDQPLPCFTPSNKSGGSSVLAVLSEHFAKWSGNFEDVKAILSDPLFDSSQAGLISKGLDLQPRPAANIFFPEKSAHLSQSDFGILFPRVVKYFAQAEEPERTIKLNVRAMLQVLRNSGIHVAATSSDDMEMNENAKLGLNTGLAPVDTQHTGDWRILDGQKGLVRGWISLAAHDSVRPKLAGDMSPMNDDDSLRSLEGSTSSGNLSEMEPAIGNDQLVLES